MTKDHVLKNIVGSNPTSSTTAYMRKKEFLYGTNKSADCEKITGF